MDLRRPGLVAAALLGVVAALCPVSAQTGPTFWDDLPDHVLVPKLLEAMGDEDLLAQVFLVGYVNEDGGPSGTLKRWVAERKVGGVKIFPRNVSSLEQIARDVGQLQTAAMKDRFRIPLFVATDQEGGWIRHIRYRTSASAGNLSLGASALPEDAYRTGNLLGLELRALGINMNFAPTIDVYTNPDAEVIGPRAFSSNPVTTGMLGVAYFRGMDDAGIICTAKHYPGHGDADVDSHGALPVIPVSMETLWSRDLVPYRFLVREGLPAVMSGHLSFPAILGDDTPSSLSHLFMTDVLRGRLGFEGIAVTDDLEMEGVLRGRIDMSTASRMALEAGNDVILLSHVPPAQELAWTALLAEMRARPAFRARVREAVERILAVKLRYFKGKRGFPLVPGPASPESVPAPVTDGFWFDQAARSVTLIRSEGFPFTPEDGRPVLIISPYVAFREEGLRRYRGARALGLVDLPAGAAALAALTRDYDTIIVHLAASQIDRSTLQVLRRLEGFEGRLAVIASFSPAYLDQLPWVRTALAVYGDTRDSFRAGVAALAGDFPPAGKLPVEFMKP